MENGIGEYYRVKIEIDACAIFDNRSERIVFLLFDVEFEKTVICLYK